jgi:hypothetical protein
MWESFVGVAKPTTRQKAGSPEIVAPSSGVNVPAGINSALVIIAFGCAREVRLSQGSGFG